MAKKQISIEKIVNKAAEQVLKGHYNLDIIHQLAYVTEQIQDNAYEREEKEMYFPMFKDCNNKELAQIRTRLYRRLQDEIVKPERTYLQTFRIIIACSNMYPCRNMVAKNDKMKFLNYFWALCCINVTDLKKALKQVALLD